MQTYNWTFSPNEWVLLNTVQFNCLLEVIVLLLYLWWNVQHAFKIFSLQFWRKYIGKLIYHYLLFYYLYFTVSYVTILFFRLLFSINMLFTNTMVLFSTKLIWSKTMYTGSQKRAGLRFSILKIPQISYFKVDEINFQGGILARFRNYFGAIKSLNAHAFILVIQSLHCKECPNKAPVGEVTMPLHTDTSRSLSRKWNALVRRHMCPWEHAGELFSGLFHPQS